MHKQPTLMLVMHVTLVLLAFGPQADASGTALRGSGNITTRDYPVTGFTGVWLSAGFQGTVTGGDTYKVTVTADDNVFDAVSVGKQGDMLRVALDSTKYPSITTTRLEVAITIPELRAVDLSGGSRLQAGQPLPKASSLSVNASGGARADLGSLTVDSASVTLSGGAQATLGVRNALDYSLSGGAQLHYSGSPTIGRSEASGGAQVVHD